MQQVCLKLKPSLLLENDGAQFRFTQIACSVIAASLNVQQPVERSSHTLSCHFIIMQPQAAQAKQGAQVSTVIAPVSALGAWLVLMSLMVVVLSFNAHIAVMHCRHQCFSNLPTFTLSYRPSRTHWLPGRYRLQGTPRASR